MDASPAPSDPLRELRSWTLAIRDASKSIATDSARLIAQSRELIQSARREARYSIGASSWSSNSDAKS